MQELTFEELQQPVRRLRERFEKLIEAHRPELWRYCLRLTGSAWDAEDLVQETLMKAFAHLANLGQSLHVKAYLFRIASHAWIDTVRRIKPVADDLSSALEVQDSSVPPDFLATKAAMEALVKELPPRQRVTFLLIEVFDFRPSEVAAMIGATEGAVKAALHRARSALRASAADPKQEAAIARSGLAPPDPLIARYLAAFNKRDPDAIVALLEPSAVNEIVGDWEEHGVEMIRKYSLTYWAADQTPQSSEFRFLEGKPTVFIFARTRNAEKALSGVIALDVARDRILRQRWYYFCPEFLHYAADSLGLPAETHGYRYVPPPDPRT